ncbi:hypothetical protein AB0L59_16310 [Streptomyces sp. NPDC052109]|uniref:hypothetical protein n=1 Tax=Streptomyces sp. NPDC052109 TaxID=3155527 RepID=UPI00341FBC9D
MLNEKVEKTRSLTGCFAVLAGDLTITTAAVLGIWWTRDTRDSVAILSSAFTAVSSMTTAYFGIKGISNTAPRAVHVVSPKSGE